jgi:glutamate-1-semialdehyde 2,1-aminomutase
MVRTEVSSENSSEALFERARLYIPGGVNSGTRAINPPIVWQNAQGSKLYDVGGKEYIDYHAAFRPIIIGHNYPAINRKVAESLQSIDLVGVGTTESEILLAAKLCEHVPSAERALLCISGSEATRLPAARS